MKRIPLPLGLGLAISLVVPQVASAKQCHQRCNHRHGRVVVRQPVCQPRPQAPLRFQVGRRPVNSIYPPVRVIQPGYFGNACPPRRPTYVVPARNYPGVSSYYCR